MHNKLETVIARLRQATTLEALEQDILNLRDLFEVDHVVYHAVNAEGGQYAALSYSHEWMERYRNQHYERVDPVVQESYRRFEPVDWRQLDWSSRAAKAFRHEASMAGVGSQGLSVPVRGPGGQFALFTVNHETSEAAWARQSAAQLGDLILTAHYVNQTALALEGGVTGATPSLSPREVDALSLLATGQNRARAAERLAISEHTLRVYIESARFKLGAANTTHAVARAIAHGLLAI